MVKDEFFIFKFWNMLRIPMLTIPVQNDSGVPSQCDKGIRNKRHVD